MGSNQEGRNSALSDQFMGNKSSNSATPGTLFQFTTPEKQGCAQASRHPNMVRAGIRPARTVFGASSFLDWKRILAGSELELLLPMN